MAPSPRRRLAFRAVSAVVASALALAALRGWGSEWRWTRAALEESAARGRLRVPGPGDSLIVHCEARGPYCEERYGAGLGFCWKADCESPASGLTTTPQGFVGPRGRVVREGAAGAGVVRIVAHDYLDPVVAAGVDTLVLGCTHYPLLTGVISYVGGDGVPLSRGVLAKVAR